MAKMTIGQKATRVLQFMLGLRNELVWQNLASHGFTADDLAEGFRLLEALTTQRLNVGTQIVRDPSTVAALDAWENRWFPIAVASLRTRYPVIHERLFRNLTQTEGPEVIVSVGTFVGRFDELKSVEGGREALALLAKRGITEAVVAEARTMLKKVEAMERAVVPAPPANPEEEAKREEALWNWYREWGGIARVVVSDRRQLKALGFLDDSGHATASADELVDLPAGVATGTTPTTPITTTDRPRIDPGMPGANPFGDGN